MVDIILGVKFGVVMFLANMLIANHKTQKERSKIVQLAHHSTGDRRMLAVCEFDDVDYADHLWRCFCFRRRDVLYGPIIQNLLLHGCMVRLLDNEFFWMCYEKIYHKLTKKERATVNRALKQFQPHNLPMLLDFMGWELPDYTPAPKFVMAEAATEYEEIMAMTEMTDGIPPQ